MSESAGSADRSITVVTASSAEKAAATAAAEQEKKRKHEERQAALNKMFLGSGKKRKPNEDNDTISLFVATRTSVNPLPMTSKEMGKHKPTTMKFQSLLPCHMRPRRYQCLHKMKSI